MNTRSLILTAGLAVLSLFGATAAQACKYCWSAENAEAADYARQAMQAPSAPNTPPGAFPLDAAISQYQPPAPAVTLAAPPAADSVVTSGADLRAARAAATGTPIAPHAVVAPPAPAAPAFAPKATAEFTPQGSAHYADAGLLGLVTVGGVFCWRTRRKTAPAS